MATIEVNGVNYELRYSLKRVEMIENVTGIPMMSEMYKNNSMLSVSSLKTYFAYGLKLEGADMFLPTAKAIEIAETAIETVGYPQVVGVVFEALQRDCPFFFQEG